MKKDLSSRKDVEHLINQFYSKVVNDELLSPFFKHLDFEIHLPKMYHFWCFALLNESGYTTNVTEKHLHMPIKQEHFDRWLKLFNETVDNLYSGEKAEMAKQRAFAVGWTISHKMNKSH